VSTTTSLRRVVLFISGVAVGLILMSSAASAAPQKDSTNNTSPQPASKADFSGNGANKHGDFDSTRDGTASGNGNGGGKAKGKPCAGCVGKADNKNPKAQAPRDADRNAGYECDRNHGIGRSNPAHTGCRMGSGSETSGTVESNTGTVPQVDPSVDSKPVIDTVVAGVEIERAASPSAANAGTTALASGTARNAAVNGLLAGVAGQATSRDMGLTSLPLTGAGVGVLTLALVAVALLGIGFVLVRRSRAAAA